MSDKFKGPFGGVDEQAVNDHLEGLVGINRSFRLMDIARAATQSASGNQFTLNPRQKVDPEKVFRKRAENENFSKESIDFYVKYFRSWG